MDTLPPAPLINLYEYGLAGVLISVLFYFYRKDVRSYTELWKNANEVMIQVIKESNAAQTILATTLAANTEILRSLAPQSQRRLIEATLAAAARAHSGQPDENRDSDSGENLDQFVDRSPEHPGRRSERHRR
jgi:hypothetical protein